MTAKRGFPAPWSRERAAADRLLDHLKTCRTCKRARVRNTDTFCDVGRTLIEMTTKERHG